MNIYLSLGSNLGDRYEHIQDAKQGLKASKIEIIKESQIYETEPWGEKDQPQFLNQCIEVETKLEPELIMAIIDLIELTLNKEKTTKYGPRTIDIDILYYQNQRLESDNLMIPHPEIKNRKFVLTPLAEIAPDFIDPLDKVTIKQLESDTTDNCKVNIWTNSD